MAAKAHRANPAVDALVNEVETGIPLRVPLVEVQSARGLRNAISRAVGRRGLTVETAAGEGFVAVRNVDELRTRKGERKLH